MYGSSKKRKALNNGFTFKKKKILSALITSTYKQIETFLCP